MGSLKPQGWRWISRYSFAHRVVEQDPITRTPCSVSMVLSDSCFSAYVVMLLAVIVGQKCFHFTIDLEIVNKVNE